VQGGINANYTVFNGFNRANFLMQSNANLLAQSFLVQRTNQDVIFNVTSQYLTVLLDQELYRIAVENASTQQVILDQINGQVEVGARAEADQFTQDALVKKSGASSITCQSHARKRSRRAGANSSAGSVAVVYPCTSKPPALNRLH